MIIIYMSSKLSDNIPKDSIFWIKWELEDQQGNKFDPPQYHYYHSTATGEKRNNMLLDNRFNKK